MNPRRPLPSWDFLNTYLIVDEMSPSGLRWKNVRGPGRVKPGDVAGHGRYEKNGKKYWVVSFRLENKSVSYLAHRIVYYLCTKTDPGLLDIDHKNTQENSMSNLRLATNSLNQANKSKQNTYKGKKTTSKYKGVIFRKDKQSKQWQARIRHKKQLIQIGMFNSEIEAAKAYDKKAFELYGEFAKLNFG